MKSVDYLYVALFATVAIHLLYIGSLVRRYLRVQRESRELEQRAG